MENIKNYDVYISRMEASLQEKLYFLNGLSPDVKYILDFGCANGVLLGAVKEVGYTCFGIDNEEVMQNLARKRLGSAVEIYSSLEEYLSKNSDKVKHTAIILSSVIHEIFSYSSLSDALLLLKSIFKVGFKQICIRDMSFNETLYYSFADNADIDKIKGHKLYSSYKQYLGHDVSTSAELYHFLLKYNYEDNWERELVENYVVYSMEELLSLFHVCMGSLKYHMSYFEHKVLEYTRNKVYEDFGIIMNKSTNYKLIYTLD